MKKLLLVPILALAFSGGFILHRPVVKIQTVVHTKTVTQTKTVQAPQPVYHVGDTQDGITLVGIYPYSYQNMRGGKGPTPKTVNLLYFSVSGVKDISELAGHTQVLAVDGSYLATDGPTTIPACDNPCIGYIASAEPAAFLYKNLRWEL